MKEICQRCKRSKYQKGSGSLTDWITCCRCDLKSTDLEQGSPINFCNTCGKRIREGRSGSLTQFIFRFDLCSCDKPDWIPAPLPPVEEETESLQLHEHEETLDFNPNLFPIERYKPISVLSEGVTDGVYVCRDVILNKLVAVKIIHSAPAEKLIAFQNEAKRLSKLDASESDRILDFGATKSGAYQVLELRRDKLNPGDVKAILEAEDKYDKALDGEGENYGDPSDTESTSYSHSLDSVLNTIKPTAVQSVAGTKNFRARSIAFGVTAVAILASSAYFISRVDTAQKPVGTHTSRLLIPLSHPDAKSSYHIKRVGQTFWLSGEKITREAFKEIAADPTTCKPFSILFANDPDDVDWDGLNELKSRQLESLIVEHTLFGDNECKLVSTFPTLRSVNLTASKVTDLGVDSLCDSKTIDTFLLSGTKTTSACLKSFLKKPDLASLECDGLPGLGLEDLKFLAQFKKLRHLTVNHIRFGDNGLKIIAGFPALSELEVSGCDLTDNGIKFLAGSKIRTLVIPHNMGITDRSIPYFKKMSKLSHLHLGHPTGISAAGELKLSKSLTKVGIDHESGFGARVRGDASTTEALNGIELLGPSLGDIDPK